MKKRNTQMEKEKQVRMLSMPDAAVYMGVGYNTARDVCRECDAVRHIGKRVLVDLRILDRYLDALPSEKDA